MGLVFRSDIGLAVFAIGDGQSLPHQRAGNVGATSFTYGDSSAITINVLRVATDGPISDQIIHRPRSGGATTPSLAVSRLARLPTLGRINTKEPYALTVHVESVAINHRYPTDHGLGLGGHSKQKG